MPASPPIDPPEDTELYPAPAARRPLPPDPSRHPWYPMGALVEDQAARMGGTMGRVQTLPSLGNQGDVKRWVAMQPYSKARIAAELLLDVLEGGDPIDLRLADVLIATSTQLGKNAPRVSSKPSPAPAVPPVSPPPFRPLRPPYRVEELGGGMWAIVAADGHQVGAVARVSLAASIASRLNAGVINESSVGGA